MIVHLVDGTYELFRHFFGMPSAADADGREVGAVVGVLASMLSLIEEGATHVGIATDHVIESFRNELWPGYKTGDGIDPLLRAQFHPLEDALRAFGFVVWEMIELEADDGLASGAALAAADPTVERVVICTPDKDLAQCVRGDRVVQFDRRRREVRDAAGVETKFGVPPASIPDYLALVGDSADGFPGVPRWGPKSASTLLAAYGTLESIPDSPHEWTVDVRGAAGLADNLARNRAAAMLFKDLATLRDGAPLFESVESLRWLGPAPGCEAWGDHLRSPGLVARARRLAQGRGHPQP